MQNVKKYKGICKQGYQLASGRGANNPFGDSTIKLQLPYFKERGFDLYEHIPNFVLGSVNVVLDNAQLKLKKADYTFEDLYWTDVVAPETFSFIHCTLEHNGSAYKGLVYYPHPETKPATNAHHYDRIEVIAEPVIGLEYGDEVTVVLSGDAFEEFA